MQGPITVLDGGVYAGDAKIDDLPPGSQRLISYSMDLDTEVAPESKPCPEQILSVRLVKGVMYVDRKFSQAHQFTVKNSGKKAKKVLIEYPFSAAWKLVEPKEPAEKTRDHYRFAVNAKPGEPAVLAVQEERTEGQQIGLSNVDDNTIRFYQASAVTSDKVKAAMAEVIRQKAAIGQVVQKRQDLERRIQTINEDQSRIRQNMAQLDHNSDVYKTYVKKFSDEEQEIEKLRGQIQELTGQENDLRKKLDDYLMGLDLS
jgi:DNA repair exonuclease SbcCD ATPase subunit